jgi:hypothetical protein
LSLSARSAALTVPVNRDSFYQSKPSPFGEAKALGFGRHQTGTARGTGQISHDPGANRVVVGKRHTYWFEAGYRQAGVRVRKILGNVS